jgi:hypothetical protein
MEEVRQFAGRCHCGNLAVTFETRQPPDGITVRACGCSFCRHHGARTVSDPEGRISFIVHDPAALNRYRFGLGTADFLLCRTCGVYVGAMMEAGGSACAIVNVNCFDPPHPFDREGVPVSYDAESEPARRARRAAGWTPVVAFAPGGRTLVP